MISGNEIDSPSIAFIPLNASFGNFVLGISNRVYGWVLLLRRKEIREEEKKWATDDLFQRPPR